MPRVKRGINHLKRRRKLLRRAKGFSLGRKNLIKQAKTAVMKAGAHAYIGRKLKKRTARRLWNIKINAAARSVGTTYSALIHKLQENKSTLNRKVLADLGENHPKVFKKLVESL